MHISTRMLRSVAMLGIAMVGSTALAVGPLNSVTYSQDFESTLLWADNALVKTTNGWFSGTADASSISNNVNITGFSGAFPIAGDHTTLNRVIRLSTEGTTLTNQFAPGAASFASAKLYVDQMVNFVRSEDIPTAVSNDVNVKAAVFINATSNLVVYCGGWDIGNTDYADTKFVVTTNKVNPGTWYRLTITLDAGSSGATTVQAFTVKINGADMKASVAYADKTAWTTDLKTTAPLGGSWFLSAARRPAAAGGGTPVGDRTVVNSLAYQGTGYIDDLVVTATEPIFTAGSFTITQFVGSNGSASPGGTITVTAGGQTSIVYTASQWFRIAALTNDTTNVSGAVDKSVYTNTLTVNANRNTYVHFKAATATQASIPETVDPDWANNYYLTEAAAANDGNLAMDYLLNVNPTGTYSPSLAITSITVAGSSITVVVQLKDGVNPLDTTINGKLIVQGKVLLSDPNWIPIGGPATITGANFDASGMYTVPFTDSTYKFYQATIVP